MFQPSPRRTLGEIDSADGKYYYQGREGRRYKYPPGYNERNPPAWVYQLHQAPDGKVTVTGKVSGPWQMDGGTDEIGRAIRTMHQEAQVRYATTAGARSTGQLEVLPNMYVVYVV